MSFVQKEDVLIVLDETHLGFATFVLPIFHHFKFGLFDVSNSIWIQMLQQKNNEQPSVYQIVTRALWSWRGLNPRPNVELIRFLHA